MTTTTVPGDPGGIRSAAGVLGETSEDAEDVVSKLKNLHDCSGDSMWRGPAADAFRAKLGELPDKLVKLRDSYGIASDALYRFANDVDQLQDEAGVAEQTETWAEDQVDFREREKQDAEICYPDADLSAYDQAIHQARQKLCAAKEEVAQVGESYRAAEDRCIASLSDAGDAGIENTFFGTVRDCLAFVEKWASIIGTVLVIAAIVAAIAVALFFTAGTAAFFFTAVGFALKALAVIGGLATLGRWLLGDEIALSDMAFAILGVVTLGALGKGSIIAKALAKAGKFLGLGPVFIKAGSALMGKLPPGLRTKVAAVVKVLTETMLREAGVGQFLDFVYDKVIGPLGPTTSLPGILEVIFREPACSPPPCPPEVPDAEVPAPPNIGEPADPQPASPATESTPVSTGPTGPGTGGGRGGGGSGGAGGGGGGGSGGASDQGGSAPPPAAGGSSPTPTVFDGPSAECGPGADQVASPGQDPPAVDAGDLPLLTDPSSDVITITLPDGTVVTIDPPGDGVSGGESCDDGWSSDRQAPGVDQESELPQEPLEPDIDSWLDGDDGLADNRPEPARERPGQMPEAQAFDDLRDLPDDAGSSGGSPPGPNGSGAQPAPTPAPPGPAPTPALPGPAPEPVAAEEGSVTTQDAPAPAAPPTLASARSKMPLGSPLLIGGLAAGGLVGGGAAYVITEARHKMRKEQEDELPLPQPVGLRF